MNDDVIRYVATYVNTDGMRTLMCASQARNTYATKEEAAAWLRAVAENNSPDRIREVWGDNPRFEVRPCPCWPGHDGAPCGDPKGIYFESED